MVFGIGRGIFILFFVLNFCMYIVIGVIVGWVLNKNIDFFVGVGGYVGWCCICCYWVF